MLCICNSIYLFTYFNKLHILHITYIYNHIFYIFTFSLFITYIFPFSVRNHYHNVTFWLYPPPQPSHIKTGNHGGKYSNLFLLFLPRLFSAGYCHTFMIFPRSSAFVMVWLSNVSVFIWWSRAVNTRCAVQRRRGSQPSNSSLLLLITLRQKQVQLQTRACKSQGDTNHVWINIPQVSGKQGPEPPWGEAPNAANDASVLGPVNS